MFNQQNYLIMIAKISQIIEALDNPQAKINEQLISFVFWLVILAGFFFCCLFFTYVFQ